MSQRNVLVRFAAAAIGIVAIAIAAATVSSPIEPGGDGGSGSGTGDGAGDGSGAAPPPTELVDTSGGLPPVLEYLISALFVIVAVVAVWYLITHRRDAVRLIAVALVLAAVTAVVVYIVMQGDFGGMAGEQPASPELTDPGGDTGPGGDGDQETDPPSLGPLLGALVLVATIFVGGLVLSRGSSDADGGQMLPDGPDESGAAAVGAAAGRAADRIAASDEDELDNEVYRAWRDMTRLLDVDRPASSTPGEFATAAVDAGIDRDHVDELTGLFEEIRYGHVETTAAREERAVDVLRRIEAAYSEGDDGGD